MNPSGKLLVCIYSDANALAVNIFNNLVAKNCFVNIVTEDFRNWKKGTTHVSVVDKFSILQRKKIKKYSRFDYVIFCGGFINTKNAYLEFERFLSLPNLSGTKTLILFPFEVFDKNLVGKIKINDNSAVLYIGDLLGPGINLESDLLISKTINEIVQKRQMSIGIGEIFYPIFIVDITKLITKWLFSFGPYGKEILVLGRTTSGDVFWNQNQKLVGKIKLIYDPSILIRNVPRDLNIEKIDSDLTLSLTETYQWLKNLQTKIPVKPKIEKLKKVRIVKISKPKKKIKVPGGLKPAVILLIIFFTFPFIMLLMNFFVSFIGYKEFVGGNDENAGNTILLAKSFAVIAESESRVLDYIPVVNMIYKEVTFLSGFVGDVDEAVFHSVPVVRNSAELFEYMLSSGIYNPGNESSKISSGLAFLHDDIMSIKELTDSASKENVILAKKILTKIDFDKYLSLTLQGRVIADNTPNILGENGIKTYLILFQNNMELRPTGGFIGSYGLATFDSGRLTDLTINDVYSADGQLNGHVEPPAPIRDYLGEANWWLRDSNWDPDFPTSAQRAEWFLNKEIGKSVDGVVAIDLSPIKDILAETEPIYLSDFNLNITGANLYEKVEAEVQDKTFAGTHQKASFLTALSRNLLGSLEKLNSNQKIVILKTFYNALDTRHLQVFLHNASSQNAISSIEWDGSVTLPTCGDGCYADTVGLVEANLGVNKANYFIKRSVNLNIKVDSNQIERTLTLSLNNTANPALGPAGKYKDYIRLLVPEDANILSVTESSGQSEENVSPDITEVKDRKEVGTLVEVLGGQNENITFSWKSNIPAVPIFQYLLYIRKQAGLDSLPITLSVSTPSLTKGSPYLYNAILTRDLLTRFSI